MEVLTAEHRAKLSAAAKRRYEDPAQRAHLSRTSKAAHAAGKFPRRRKANAGRGAMHYRVRQVFPYRDECAHCGTSPRQRKHDLAFKRHPEPYTDDLADYIELLSAVPSHIRRGVT
jgi:hypothetical protein